MAFKLKNKGIHEKFQNGYNRQSSLGFENPETPNKFIFGKLRDEISEDVGVWGYQNAWPRVKQAIFGNEESDAEWKLTEEGKNEKFSSANLDNTIQDVYNQQDGKLTNDQQEFFQDSRERVDLFKMMMGKDQKYNTILSSDYRPGDGGDENTEYLRSPQTDKWIQGEIQNNPNFIKHLAKLNKDREKWIEENKDNEDFDMKNAPSRNWVAEHGPQTPARGRFNNTLGHYTLSMGEDDKGKYISYYDKWDLQPFKNKFAAKLGQLGQKIIGVKPREVYNRIYI